jgi:hypothetical protein
MKVLHALTGARWRPALLAVVLAGALVPTATATAAANTLTLDSTAALSPGMLHATLTGTVTCEPSGSYPPYLSGQIVQAKGGSGYGSAPATCDGTPQPFSLDIATGGIFGGTGPFKAGKASAQVSMSTCDPFLPCTPTYTDAVIRLVK